MPGGVAVFDYDGDGRLDVYFTNGARQPQLAKVDPSYWNRLWRNRGDGTFEDVTVRAGLRAEGYCMGVAAGDFDNDGYPDLFVAGVRRNYLFHNRGDGTFADRTAAAGLDGPPLWSIAAGWFDYDRDGRLDLFVVRYVKWNPAEEPFCGSATGAFRTYCHPKFYQPLPNALYHNEGNGKFRDVSSASGIGAHLGKGMGVAFGDYDDDGWPDVAVANDAVPNFLFRNNRDGTFEQTATAAGVAYNDDGRALSSMGVEFRDYDNDGRDDLFFTALIHETFPLFRNLGRSLFADMTYRSGVGRATLALSGWGAGCYDLDNDGWKDLFTANGDVQDNTELFSERASRQRSLMLMNDEHGKFQPVPVGPLGLFRGAAFGDLDGDGRIDVILTRLGDSAVLLHNETGPGRHWLRVRLQGTSSNRDGLGAKLHLILPSGREQWNYATTSVGYASASEPAVHFGLGGETRARTLEIAWPSGVRQTLTDVAADQLLRVIEPSATAPAPAR